MMLAHIGGIPVEESLMSIGPVAAVGFGVVVRSLLARLRRPQDTSR
jgi:hypothetical protein